MVKVTPAPSASHTHLTCSTSRERTPRSFVTPSGIRSNFTSGSNSRGGNCSRATDAQHLFNMLRENAAPRRKFSQTCVRERHVYAVPRKSLKQCPPSPNDQSIITSSQQSACKVPTPYQDRPIRPKDHHRVQMRVPHAACYPKHQ